MDNSMLFTMALMLQEPWKVVKVEFREINGTKEMELHIYLGFDKGSTFPCPVGGCNEQCKAYDTKECQWRHLNFFQYKTILHAKLPRVKCGEHGVHRVHVPWARPESGFTLLFESMVLELVKHMPVLAAARLVGEYDTRLWRFITRIVDEARTNADYSQADAIGVDETSRKGHDYITTFTDIAQSRAMYVTEGKDSATVSRFREDFIAHGGLPEKVRVAASDMSQSFLRGMREAFPNATQVIDKFHVVKNANDAVDKVRREEAKTAPCLKKTKYLWLKNKGSLTAKQSEKLAGLSKMHLKTERAYAMRLSLQDIYETCVTREEAKAAMKKLYFWLSHSRLAPMIDFGKTLKEHMEEILNYFEFRCTNAMSEGGNSVIQNIKCRARGFRAIKYFKTMIYLVRGKLDFGNIFGDFSFV